MTTEQMGMEVATVGAKAPATQDAEPASLVQLAIEKGVDVEVIERLVALQERVTDRSARAAYFEAVSRFQESVPEIPKSKRVNYVTKTGARIDYTYAPLDAITRGIRTPLRVAGLSYSWDVDGSSNGVMTVSCTLRHVDGHSERSTFPVPVDTAAKMSNAQANGAALTYGKRQSLVAVLGLTTTDDDVDGVGPYSAPAGEVETITASEAADLGALIDEVKADRAKFCRFFRIESVEDMPAARMKEAMALLEERRRNP
jgi:hypothetical protein